MVEDDPDVQKINRMALERHGFRVLEAATMAAGLALLRENSVDLLLLDVMLPDGSGVDFCHRARGITGAPVLL